MKQPRRDSSWEWGQNAMSVIFFVLFFVTFCSIANGQTKPEIESAIRELAQVYGVDEDTAVAIAKVESGLNPKAVGGLGEIGVFQLRPEFHDVRPGHVNHNKRVALRYLSELQKKCSHYGDAWFVCFNLGPNYKRLNHPEKFPYYIKVVEQRRKLAGGGQ